MAEETWHAARLIPASGISGPEEPERRATSALLAAGTAVNHFDHIRSIIDAVFGPDDNSPVPTAGTMTAAHDFTTCTGCGNDIPAAAFWLCGPCHQLSLDEASQEARHS